MPGLALTLALSRYTPEPERLGAALDEARLALSIGERLGRQGEVVTFEETGTYKLLFQIFADRPEELISFYDQTLAPLVRYDEQYQTELVGTLSTYLGNDCNLAATASTLYTHRHTVRYRLDRIAELSGLDIAKTDDREKLSLGLKAMRLLGRRVAHGGRAPAPGRRPPLAASAGSERVPQDPVQVVGQRPRPPVAHGPPVHLHHGHRPGDGVGEHDLAGAAPGVLGERLLARRRPTRAPGRGRSRAAARPPARSPRSPSSGAEGVAQRRLAQAPGRVQHQRVVGAGGGRRPLGRGGGRRRRGSCTPRRRPPATTLRAPRSPARPGGAHRQRLLGRRLHQQGGTRGGRQPHPARPRRRSPPASPRRPARARSRPGMGLRSSARAASASRSRWRSSSATRPPSARIVSNRPSPQRTAGSSIESGGSRRVHQASVEPDHPVCENARRVPGRRSRSVHAADGTKGTRRVA